MLVVPRRSLFDTNFLEIINKTLISPLGHAENLIGDNGKLILVLYVYLLGRNRYTSRDHVHSNYFEITQNDD